MEIRIQVEVFSILIILTFLCSLCYFCGRKIKSLDPSEKPKGLANAGIILVSMIDSFTAENMGEKFKKSFAPYIGTIAMYILFCNIIGLLGLPAPTANYSITFTLAFLSWVIFEYIAISSGTLKDFITGFFEPAFPFVILNVIGEVAPLISMSLRLFGNIIVGGILMSLVYSFTAYLSSFIPVIGGINIFGPIIAPVLHAYFDVFAGFIQMFIFISLTTILAGNKAA
jgi:F0F1-type ATP synthase, subunit a